MDEDFYIEQLLESGEELWEGEKILHWSLEIPTFSQHKKGTKRLQRYYNRVGEIWKNRWVQHLVPQAKEEFLEKREHSHLFYPWYVSLESTQELLSATHLSVGLTGREKRGRALTTVTFYSDLWDIKQGIPLNPTKSQVISSLGKIGLLEEVIKIAENQKEIKLYADVSSGIQRYFKEKSIFFTKEGVDIYFPQGTIAPPEEGTPKFTISSEKI